MTETAPTHTKALALVDLLGRSCNQTGESLLDLSARSRVLLVFLRHAGCSFCREALSDIAQARPEIQRKGIRIVLIHMGDTDAFEALLLKNGLQDIDHICDPGQELYKAFGIRRGSLGQLFGPKVLWRALPGGVLARFGIGPATADPAQMPAIFLISDSGIVNRFRHRSAADRPDYLSFCAMPEASA